MNATQAYGLLEQACRVLDATGDHAVAAHVGHGMALLEQKYGIDPDAPGSPAAPVISRIADGKPWG